MSSSKNLTLKNVKALHSKNLPYIKKIISSYTLLIHPMYLGDIKNGVKIEMDSLKKNYCQDFKGIVLGYDNVKVQPYGKWIDTNPYMHLDINAEFYVFAPEIGTVVKGKVVKKSSTHVGCLIHNLFNASSDIPNGVSKANWYGNLATEGDTLDLELTCVDLTSSVPYLRGIIVPESIKKSKDNLNQSQEIAPNTRIIFEEMDSEIKQEQEPNDLQSSFTGQIKKEIKEETSVKKKKKNKDKN